MAYEIKLPSAKIQREDVLKAMIQTGKRHRTVKEVEWRMTHHYLQGCREFSGVNYELGTLNVSYINEDGVLRFRYDEVVAKFQAQVGRMMAVNLGPRVQKKSVGLEDMRKASIAQVVLDYVYPATTIEKLKLEVLPSLTKYGCIGLIVWNRGEDIGIEVIMPWELLPIPGNPLEDKDVRGLARVRLVPLEWIQQLEGTPAPDAKIYQEMDKVNVSLGSIPSESGSQFTTFAETTVPTSYKGKSTTWFGSKKKDQTHTDIVELAEIFLETATGHLARYEMLVGGKLLKSDDHSKSRTPMPIVKCNDIKTGDFWGRSFVGMQIPMNTEMEYTLGRVFQNVQDWDAYGVLCVPSTLGIPPTVLRGSDGMKRLMYNPDYTLPDLKPFVIPPGKDSKLAGEVLKIGSALADKMANQPASLMRGEAPGRVDSKLGLGFLQETSNITLMPSAAGLANGLVQCYAATLGMIGAGVWPSDKLVQVTMLDDSLAGVILNAGEGTISLEMNAIPRPDQVGIYVQSMAPQSKEQQKMELMKSLEIGAIDMFEYRIVIRKEGLELPVGNEAEWQNYRQAMLENIILFGDGQQTKPIVFDEDNIHEVHMRIHQAFMARPEFFQASATVQDAFKKHYEAHVLALGQMMPDAAPFPEEAAEEQDMMEKMREQQQGV